jgi:hypothetical protein
MSFDFNSPLRRAFFFWEMTMGAWYKVTKRINGRLYDYWQRTERLGRSVKTYNKYIGPSGRTSMARSPEGFLARERMSPGPDHINERLRLTNQDPGTLEDIFTGSEEEIQCKIGGHSFTVYRVVPPGKVITRGDFVFDSEELAQDYLSRFGHGRGVSEIVTARVNADDLTLAHSWEEEDLAQGEFIYAPNQYERTVVEHRNYLANSDYDAHIPAPEPPEPEPRYTNEEAREERARLRAEKKEFDAAMKEQTAKLRRARRETKGIKSANPFIAKALRK